MVMILLILLILLVLVLMLFALVSEGFGVEPFLKLLFFVGF